MNALHSLAVLALLASPVAAAAGDDISACNERLWPAEMIAPKLPPRLHNEFEGNVVLTYVVDTRGRVQSPTIVSSEWHPVGHGRRHPIGYKDAILAAVQQWQFEQRSEPCRNETPLTFTFNSDFQPTTDSTNDAD